MRADSPSIVPFAVTATDQSARVADARSRADERLRRQRATLRPLGMVVIAAVLVEAINAHPHLALHGKGLGVLAAVCAFAGPLLFAIRSPFVALALELQAAVIGLIGAGGVALAGLQPHGASDLAAGGAVFLAVARLPDPLGVGLGAVVTAALAALSAAAGMSSSGVLASVLLCVLLGLVARFISQARASQDRAEVLLAELEDARDEQARAAAIAERGRIASELHDVLAHSLSGAAIQLQGARKLAQRSHAEPTVQAAIDRASVLVKDGLASARQAVGALRGDQLPGIAQLEALVQSYRSDMNLDVALTIRGDARPLAPDVSLALYRGAQEALTNVARYAPGASTSVELSYEAGRTKLTVENSASPSAPALPDAGGGRGLEGMRERIERAGGTARAGASQDGWRVDLEVPA
jgi:signal transduction histidine kinase